jgi:hypothetical protein
VRCRKRTHSNCKLRKHRSHTQGLRFRKWEEMLKIIITQRIIIEVRDKGYGSSNEVKLLPPEEIRNNIFKWA